MSSSRTSKSEYTSLLCSCDSTKTSSDDEDWTDFIENRDKEVRLHLLEEEAVRQNEMELTSTCITKKRRKLWLPKFFGNLFKTRGAKENLEKSYSEIRLGLLDRFTAIERLENEIAQFSDDDDVMMVTKNEFYWSTENHEFMPKEWDEEYDWSDYDNVWFKSSSVDWNPYSWFWNSRAGKFHVRNKTTPDKYVFDQHANIFKNKRTEDYRRLFLGILPGTNNRTFGVNCDKGRCSKEEIWSHKPNTSLVNVKESIWPYSTYQNTKSMTGLEPQDYFYCENVNKWIPKSEAVQGETEEYINGKREIIKGPRGATGLAPDDFYYSGLSGKFEHKDRRYLYEYYYDIKDEMFKKQGEAYGPGKTGLYPTDYIFSTTAGDWEPKNPVELYKPSPYDWFFDADKGRFYKLDKTQRDDYEFDQISNVWKMKGLEGPSANDLGPEDYVYDETTKDWKLESSFEPEQIEKHEAGKRKIKKGLRGKSGKIDDDFYYDSLLGEFLSKDKTKLGNYYYDTNCQVFRKRQQPYTSQLLPKQYYFDEIEGKWMPTSEAKTMLVRNKQVLRLVGEQFQTAYDYAFDPYQGTFVLRDQNRPLDYEYNAESGVYYVRGIRGPSINGKKVGDYYFDEHVYNWLPLESPKGHEARDYKNGRRNNRIGPRGISGFIPDDFYFTEGNFKEKDRLHPELYSFNSDIGVWKLINPSPLEYATNKKPSDYFFSFEEGRFILKKDLKFGEIALDKNSHLWRQKLRIPSDYIWNGKNYVLKPAKVQTKAVISKPVTAGLKTQKNEKNPYDKPWLKNFPNLAADKNRCLQEIEKIRGKGINKDEESQKSSVTTYSMADEKPKKTKPESNIKSLPPNNKKQCKNKILCCCTFLI